MSKEGMSYSEEDEWREIEPDFVVLDPKFTAAIDAYRKYLSDDAAKDKERNDIDRLQEKATEAIPVISINKLIDNYRAGQFTLEEVIDDTGDLIGVDENVLLDFDKKHQEMIVFGSLVNFMEEDKREEMDNWEALENRLADKWAWNDDVEKVEIEGEQVFVFLRGDSYNYEEETVVGATLDDQPFVTSSRPDLEVMKVDGRFDLRAPGDNWIQFSDGELSMTDDLSAGHDEEYREEVLSQYSWCLVKKNGGTPVLTIVEDLIRDKVFTEGQEELLAQLVDALKKYYEKNDQRSPNEVTNTV